MTRRGLWKSWRHLIQRFDPFVTRCNQCNAVFSKLTIGFNSKTGKWFQNCPQCRLSQVKRKKGLIVKSWRHTTPQDEPLRIDFCRESQNRKTGPIPVSTSTPHTCPPSCTWYGNGCYGESGYLAGRWKRLAANGISWKQFCQEIDKLPKGQLWRHNILGDLPGTGEDIDIEKLFQLVRANLGKSGFCFTHKKSDRAIKIAALATSWGFTVNLSCDSLEEVDTRALLGQGPLTLVVPSDETRSNWRSPGGVQIVRCPATRVDIDCARCKLCAKGERKVAVAFPAHGHAPNLVSKSSVQFKLPMIQ